MYMNKQEGNQLPMNEIEMFNDDDMMSIKGGDKLIGADADSGSGAGSGCGCGCSTGAGCGCGCSSGAGCGCNC